MIDAKEVHDEAMADILGAFMQADMGESVHVKLKGKMAKLPATIKQNMYHKYIYTKKNKSIL